MKHLKFYLITDTHYFKNSLGAFGNSYDDFMRYEQKCFAETQAINESVVNWLKTADEADIVLIAGASSSFITNCLLTTFKPYGGCPPALSPICTLCISLCITRLAVTLA